MLHEQESNKVRSVSSSIEVQDQCSQPHAKVSNIKPASPCSGISTSKLIHLVNPPCNSMFLHLFAKQW